MPNVLWVVDYLRIFGSLVLRAGHENERKNDEADKGDIDGKMITANDENAPPTLTSLKSSLWNGTKENAREEGNLKGS